MKEYLSNVLEILEEKGVLNESYDLEFKSASAKHKLRLLLLALIRIFAGA